jgi:GAF domain-containing protein
LPEAPHPPNESERITAVEALGLLDTAPDERFDRITRTAARLFGVESAVVSLVDRDRQWFKSSVGMSESETPRAISFCAHAIRKDEILVIPDATQDERVAANSNVIGEPHIRFYAGRPLHGPEGHLVGTLCVLDPKPREFSDEDRAALSDLAALVERELVAAELEELKLRFTRTVSHELRTPLTSIKGYVELLLAEPDQLPGETRQFLEVVSRNADRLDDLINDLLARVRNW